MLDMRIRCESQLSRYCHTASGAQPQPRGGTLEHDIAPLYTPPALSLSPPLLLTLALIVGLAAASRFYGVGA